MSGHSEQQSMLSAEVFHASHFPWPESKKGKRTTVSFGPKCFASSEKLSRVGLSVRTYLESSTSRLTMFAPIWSVRATKSGYLILKLRLLALRTEGKESPSLLKTPTDFDATVKSGKKSPKFGDSGSLAQEVYSGFINQRMWPTPKARDWKGQTQRGTYAPGDGLCNTLECTGGQLNPTWVEWLMGYPENYTEVD